MMVLIVCGHIICRYLLHGSIACMVLPPYICQHLVSLLHHRAVSLVLAHCYACVSQGCAHVPYRVPFSGVHCCMVHADMYESYREGACWDVVKAPPQGTVLHIVRAANSDRYNELSICKPVCLFNTCMNLASKLLEPLTL